MIRQLIEPAEPGGTLQLTTAAGGYSNSSMAHSATSPNSMTPPAFHHRAALVYSACLVSFCRLPKVANEIFREPLKSNS